MAKIRGTNFDIFVGNVPPTGDEKTVRELFSIYGEIKDIFMPESKKPSSTGAKIAFVHYTCEEDAISAIEGKNGSVWNGNNLLVRKSDKWLKRIKDAGNANPTAFVPKTIKSSHQLKKEKYEQQAYNNSNGGGIMASSSNFGAYPGDMPCYLEPKRMNSSDDPKIINMKLCLSHLVDSITFFAHAQNGYDPDQLIDLQNELQMVCTTALPVSEKLITNCGKAYATKYSEDDTWYRCTIEAVDNYLAKAKVHYIDFGNSEQVPCNSIVELPPHLSISAIPKLAFQCQLHDVSSIESAYQQSEFHDLIKDKYLMATGFQANMENSECFKIINLEADGFDVISQLVENGYLIRCMTDPYEKRMMKDRKRDLAADKMEKFQTSNFTGNRLNPKLVNNFKGLNKKNSYTYGSNSSMSEYNSNVTQNMLMSEIEDLKLSMARERGKSEAFEKKMRKLQLQQQQKPDILSQCDVFSQITSLLIDIPFITAMRQQLPVGPGMGISQDCIEMAISLLWQGKGQPTPTVDEELLKRVNEQDQLYNDAQSAIFNCNDKALFPDLVENRDKIRLELHSQLKSFCDLVEGMPLQDKVTSLEAVLMDLKRTYEPFLQMRTTSDAIPIQLQELVMFYRQIKESNTSAFREIQFRTNQAHSSMMENLGQLIKGLRLTPHLPIFSRSVLKNEFSEKQLVFAVRELKKCFQQEMTECNLEQSSHASVIAILTQQLANELSMELEKVKQLSISEKLYRQKYNEITPWLGSKPDMERIVELRKETKKIRSKFRHKLADKSDLDESEDKDEAAIEANVTDLNALRYELQKKFSEDTMEMQQISTYYHSVFPELDLLYPDLHLEQYYRYGGLVNYIRQIEYYNIEKVVNKMGIDCYISTFLNTPVTLKQYLTDGDQMQESLLYKAKEYASLKSDNLLKIDAIFFSSNCRLAYVQQERFDTWLDKLNVNTITLEEKLLILSGILEGLKTLHSANLIHGCLHPETVFSNGNSYAVLDTIPLLESKLQNLTLPTVNGISFQCPRLDKPCIQNDIYAFFCIALWLFFPDTKFNEDSSGIPDLTQLEVDQDLVEFFSPIYKFLHSVPSDYPSATELLTNYNFFGSQKNNFDGEGMNQDILSGTIPDQIVHFDDLENLLPTEEVADEEPSAVGGVQENSAGDEMEEVESSDKEDDEEETDEEDESQEDEEDVNTNDFGCFRENGFSCSKSSIS